MRSLVVSLLLALLVAPVVLAAAALVDYRNDIVVRIEGVTRPKLDLLHDLFDVWAVHPSVARSQLHKTDERLWDVDVRANRDNLSAFMHEHLPTSLMRVLNSNLQKSIDAEQARLAQRSRSYDEWFEDYHPTDEINFFYQNMSQMFPRLVTFVPSVGTTWEGRDIPVVHVTSLVGSNKKQVWIEANIHAREWITSAAVQFFVNEIVTGYGVDPRLTALLDAAELVIVPIVNPDGHSYTWTNERLWRKNRRDNGASYGVDLNRNADDHWGGEGSSGTPSSETYRGPSPASEPETQALTAYFASLPNVVAAVDVHSYGQLVLRPYAWTAQPPPDDSVSKFVGDTIRDEIFAIHGKRYTSGLWYNALYPSSGVIMDWWHQQPKVGGTVRPLAFTIELRPISPIPGFELPPEEIIPTGEELTAGLLFYAEYAVANPLPFK